MAEAFEEKPAGAKFVGMVGVYRGVEEEARGSPQSSSLIKIFNTSERPRFASLKRHGDEKRGLTADVHPEPREGWKRDEGRCENKEWREKNERNNYGTESGVRGEE